MAREAQPVTQRKLNMPTRYKMALLAVDKFRSAPLREIEAAARTRLEAILLRDATSVPKKELDTLEKWGLIAQVETFNLPYKITAQLAGSRSFERPDGEVVTREGGKTVTLHRPQSDDVELPSFMNWSTAVRVVPARHEAQIWSDPLARITLPKTVRLPATSQPHNEVDISMRRNGDDREGLSSKLTFSCLRSGWASPELFDTLVSYYRAGDERICEERRLICAAIKVIGSCDVYGQVLDFWPEVAEIEESLFGQAVVPNAFALVALSDEDKAALCSNMADRGVPSGLCSRKAA